MFTIKSLSLFIISISFLSFYTKAQSTNETSFSGKILGEDLICLSNNTYSYLIDVEGTNFSWKIKENDQIEINFINDKANIKWNSEGLFTIVVDYYNELGRITTKELKVIVLETPKPDFTYDIYTDFVDISNTTQETYIEEQNRWIYNKYYWDFGRQGDSLIEVEWDTVIVYKDGKYPIKLIAESPAGCKDSIIKVIDIGNFSGLFFPNAFCPIHSSESIRKFRAYGQNLKEFRMRIFDKWGNTIWYTDKLTNGTPSESWDGYYNGELLRNGVYFWSAEATLIDNTPWEGIEKNGKKVKIGTIVLLY